MQISVRLLFLFNLLCITTILIIYPWIKYQSVLPLSNQVHQSVSVTNAMLLSYNSILDIFMVNEGYYNDELLGNYFYQNTSDYLDFLNSTLVFGYQILILFNANSYSALSLFNPTITDF